MARDDGTARGDIHWFPTGFIVVTSWDWKGTGLLFVYVDTKKEGCPLDKFFFAVEDAYVMLSGLRLGEVMPAQCRAFYDLGMRVEDGGKEE